MMDPRTFVISVKDPGGNWTTLAAIEIVVTQPIAVYSDTAGVVRISSGGTGGALEATRPQNEG